MVEVASELESSINCLDSSILLLPRDRFFLRFSVRPLLVLLSPPLAESSPFDTSYIGLASVPLISIMVYSNSVNACL
jgi:hypothetical protein